MAASIVKLNVVGFEGRVLATAQVKSLSTEYMTVTDETKGVAGANATVYVPTGNAGGGYQDYQVTQTQTQVNALANSDTVADLTTVGNLTVGGDAAVTGTFTQTGNATFAGTATFNNDVTLGAGDDLTGSSTSKIIGFNTTAPIPTEPTAVAINATATMADGDFRKGYISSTSAAATAITTRTATQLGVELGAVAGTRAYLVINNVSGANTVTLTPGAGVTAASAVTGGTDMTVAATELATFMLVFASTTVAQICRIQ